MPALSISTDAPAGNAPPPPSASPPRPPMSPITPSHSPSQRAQKDPSSWTNNPPLPPPPHLDLNHPVPGAGGGAGVSSGIPPGASHGVVPAGGSAGAVANAPPSGVPASLSHNTHPDKVPTMPAPPPQPIDFEDNVDVIALKSAISTLQMQSRRAEADIRTLRDVKAEALQRPEDFARHIAGIAQPNAGVGAEGDDGNGQDGPEWPKLPGRIPVARCPPINWSQYAVSGQVFDALHKEQVARPAQGSPATFSDGAYHHSPKTGTQEEYVGPTAPYDPQRDRVARNTKGKR